MNQHFSRVLQKGKTAAKLAVWVAVSALLACSTYHHKITPLPMPFPGHGVEVEGARLAAQAYVEPETAEQAFGFDIRGAGLLPVRLVIDNQGRSVVKINPQQTFLIDQQGLAWPLLTAEQAQNRIVAAVGPGETLKNAALSTLWGGASGVATGFAIGIILQGGLALEMNPALAGAGFGALISGRSDTYELENRIRKDLGSKSLRNQRLPPGELAQGYLFFPGQDEAQTAQLLRLGLELDGYPQVVNVRLAPLTRANAR